MDNSFIIFKYIANSNIKEIKKLLEKDKNLIYIIGPNLQLPIHDACLQGNEEVIDLLLSYDEKILNKVNTNKNNGYHILSIYPKLLVNYITKYKPEDIHYTDGSDRTILILYLLFNKIEENILIELKKVGCSLEKPENVNSLKFLLKEKCDKLDLINKYFKIDVNKLDGLMPISFYLVDEDNLDCLKKFEKYNLDYNLNSYQDNILSYSIVKNKIKFVEYFLTKDINPDFKDNYENTYFHLILMNKSLNPKLQKQILDKISNLNHQNIFGDTILHLIFKLGMWNKLKYMFKDKDIDFYIKNKDGKTALDYSKDKKLRDNIRKSYKLKRKKTKNDIIYIEEKVPVHTAFEGYFWNVLSAVHYILSNYKNVGFPVCKRQNKKVYDLDCLMCAKIEFFNKKNYKISSKFDECLKNVIKKDLIFIYLAVDYEDTSHANIIVIDNKNSKIERFEPYGSINNIKNLELDSFLKHKLQTSLKKYIKKKFKYYRPFDYQNLYDFQHISNEYLRAINESKGLCVAWTFWYLEHRILNHNIDAKILISKLKNKLIKNNKLIIDIIRGYAEKLEQYKNKLLISYGIKKNEIYKLNYLKNQKDIFYNKILNDLWLIQKK